MVKTNKGRRDRRDEEDSGSRKRDAEERGEEIGIIKTAKNLLQLNIAIEDISKATGLSIKELKELE